MSSDSKKFEECIEKITYGNKIQRTEYLNHGRYPIVSQESNLINGYWDDEEDVYKVEKPVIIFGDHTRILKYIDFSFVLGADGTKIIKPKPFLDSKFFYYFLQANPVESKGYSRHYRFLKELKLNIPPLPLQKKIVAKLDATFSEIDKSTIAAEANVKNSDALFQSYLTEIFEHGGDSWLSDAIGNLCTELFAGGDVPKDRMSKSETSEFFIPIFTNGEKDKGLYGFTNTPRVTKPSITISARGTIGYSEIRYKPFFPAIRLLVATPNTEIIELDYLKYAIKSLKFIYSGASIPQLTVPMVKNYQIKLPKSKKEQIEIIRKLDNLSIEIENLRNSAVEKLIQLTNLRQSILNQAFNGELVKE